LTSLTSLLILKGVGKTYSTYEAKAKFGEIMRQVRAGKSVTISYRGQEVAEIRPVTSNPSLEASISRLEEEGVIIPSRGAVDLRPIAKKRGALKRFLEARE
jgi:prevent-host-death family protein